MSSVNQIGKTNDLVLCFDLQPGLKNAIPRWCTGRKWHIPMAVRRGNRVGGNWLMKWDKVIPMVHYRVMHRKRVTSELHDSYFRLMTIKYSISKIEWASNDYIIELSSTSQLNWALVQVEFDAQGGSWVEDRTELLTKCGRESHIRPKGPLGPDEWALGLQLSSTKERERHNVTVITVGSRYYSLYSISSSLSHATLEQPFRTLAIKWEVKYC